MSNIVAIVGRPNVGKSTLFNRLTETRKAIVDEQSGVTRDRHYGYAEWNGKKFSIIDTGGYVRGSEDVFEEEIRKQVDLAIEEANVIFFVVNKVDNPQRQANAAEFYKFGLGDPYNLSSINGSGTGELLDDIVKEF